MLFGRLLKVRKVAFSILAVAKIVANDKVSHPQALDEQFLNKGFFGITPKAVFERNTEHAIYGQIFQGSELLGQALQTQRDRFAF